MEEETDLEDLFEYAKGVARKRFNDVNAKSLEMIEAYITEGYKKTLINLFVYLGEERAQKALEKVPEPLHSEIENELRSNTKKRTSPEILVDAAYVYKKAGWYGRTMADEVIENLTGLEISGLNYYQEDFFEMNPILQMNIENFAISFNELAHLDDQSIQKVLREVNHDDLAMALKNTEEPFKNKIFWNLSGGGQALLREKMELLGQVRQIDVEAAQCKIVKATMKLEREGEIIICKDY